MSRYTKHGGTEALEYPRGFTAKGREGDEPGEEGPVRLRRSVLCPWRSSAECAQPPCAKASLVRA